MQLYATGLDAHSQLPTSISPIRNSPSPKSTLPSESDGLPKCTPGVLIRVLETNEAIEILASLWCATVIKQGSELWHYGFRPNHSKKPSRIDLPADIMVRTVSCMFGDVGGVLGALSDSCLLLMRDDPLRLEQHQWPENSWPLQQKTMVIEHLAIAGNEEVCIAICLISTHRQCQYQLQTFLSFCSFVGGDKPKESHDLPCPVKLLQAGTTAFAALLGNGDVLTFGSPLQPTLLARTPHADALAAIPCHATSLGGIPIAKLVMCGWIGAALSVDKDLYVWGGRAGEAKRVTALPDPGDELKLVDIAGGVDLVDVAVGMDHLLALTVEGEVWSMRPNGQRYLLII